MTGRRVVYTAERVHAMAAAMRADLVAMHERHLAELIALRAEVAELRGILQDVVRASRMKAEDDVHALRRELERALVGLERDPNKPLH